MNRHILILTVAIAVLFSVVPALRSAAPQYSARRSGDVVQLEDAKNQTVVSILPSVGDITFSMKVRGQEILRWPYASVADFKARPGLSGIPFVGPWANRLDEQAFYANGKKYAFDMNLGNVRGAIPIHGFLTANDQWQVAEVKADAKSAWIASKLEFFRQPLWMKQFSFAHTIEITHRLQDGVLQVQTRITNLSAEAMPVAVGFHPCFKLTDSSREEWTIWPAVVLWSPNPIGAGRGSAGPANPNAQGRGAQNDPNFIAFEPMAGITDAMNLAQRGLYPELQSIPPGAKWEASFWIKPSGF